MEIGKKVFINENVRVKLGLPDGLEFTIKDVLKECDFKYNIVLSCHELGDGWVDFFNKGEIIEIK
tara:strand:- start:97 stop:291 length:195 start_codon:yes stop_codon:yes gene_type:complete